MLKLTHVTLGALLAAATAPAALAEEAFKPEQVSVKEAIDPGPNVFVYQEEWKGAGSIAVFAQDTLKLKGLMPTGSMGQMLISPDGKTAWSQSSFLKRIVYGPNEQVLQTYEVDKLTLKSEAILPPKAAMALGYSALLRLSSDGKLVFVQNATPAASVSVIDVATGTTLQEIPTPGCWGIYPLPAKTGFSTICGDGTFSTVTISDDGKTAAAEASAPIFDPDADPIFIEDESYDGALYFVSYKGVLYKLDPSGKTVAKLDTSEIAAGVEGGWAPGGYQLMSIDPKIGVLFIQMHPDAKDGSHKFPAEEIWAYDLKAKKVLSRSKVSDVASLVVSRSDKPVIFGSTEVGKLYRFETDPAAGYALKPAGEATLTGFPLTLDLVE
ncbi:amine dehydrogenase large subunit [Oryzibacter oryziterrae]|uniref:amine dehydrogenase large subunit n=1 Tax=Oryzibacter oryziterrae TaxID=2766474 RepID=UPI001F46102A|nr:amine dehydrogenase large subunit [Oryzibacter oryziterrae]